MNDSSFNPVSGWQEHYVRFIKTDDVLKPARISNANSLNNTFPTKFLINACFIQGLKQSGKLDDLSFRKTYAKQLLDCVILEELLKRILP